MNVPTDRPVYKTAISTLWLDDDGILCSASKKGPPLSKEELKHIYKEVREIANNKKVCFLVEMADVYPADKETRDYAKQELETFVKAMALIGHSKTSSVIINLFMAFQKPAFPTKMFTNPEDAKQWLKQYL